MFWSEEFLSEQITFERKSKEESVKLNEWIQLHRGDVMMLEIYISESLDYFLWLFETFFCLILLSFGSIRFQDMEEFERKSFNFYFSHRFRYHFVKEEKKTSFRS